MIRYTTITTIILDKIKTGIIMVMLITYQKKILKLIKKNIIDLIFIKTLVFES
jgi:hypothetical protein